MEVGVADPQQRQQNEEKVVSFAPGEQDRDGHRDRQSREETEIRHASDRRGDAAEANQAADTPEPHEGRQKRPASGGPAGPVLDRGQQEARDDRHRKAEEHLVAVPGNTFETGLAGHRLIVVDGPPGDESGC